MDNKIIIVGNGPSLLGQNLGAQIDRFPIVVRFNNFQTCGYESDVGSKTTIWSRWYRVTSNHDPDTFAKIWISMPFNDVSVEKIETAYALMGSAEEKCEIIPAIHVSRSLTKRLYGANERNYWPSSGVLAIEHALHSGYSVTIAGIDSWSNEPYHYYEDHDRANSHHKAEIEREYVQDLLKLGKMNRLL